MPDTKYQVLNSKYSQSGQFLLELVIAIAILMMLAHAFFTLISTSYQILIQSRSQVTAKAIANEQMEIIRNLPYEDVGTIGGVPSGDLLQNETVIRNGQSYNVKTDVVYKDDPFDQLAPDDLLPVDYKVARVEVTWTSGVPSDHNITLVTNISPRGVESTDGGGTLSLLVFNSQGEPVPQATVHIEAPTADPAVDLVQSTDDFGNLILPGSPVCNNCYNVTVTKDNYSSDRTYTTSEVTNPIQPPLSVLEGSVTEASFAIDLLSKVTVRSVASAQSNFETIGNVTFVLTGSKTIGKNTLDEDVYKLDEEYATDGGGSTEIMLEWDNYSVQLDGTNYILGGSNPLEPFTVNPDTDITLKFIAVSQSSHNLLTKVIDSNGVPIASASARLYDGILFDGSQFTGQIDLPDWGQVLFYSLPPGSYSLEINHNDYESYFDSFDITGVNEKIVILNEL